MDGGSGRWRPPGALDSPRQIGLETGEGVVGGDQVRVVDLHDGDRIGVQSGVVVLGEREAPGRGQDVERLQGVADTLPVARPGLLDGRLQQLDGRDPVEGELRGPGTVVGLLPGLAERLTRSLSGPAGNSRPGTAMLLVIVTPSAAAPAGSM